MTVSSALDLWGFQEGRIWGPLSSYHPVALHLSWTTSTANAVMIGGHEGRALKWKSPYWAANGGWEYDLMWSWLSSLRAVVRSPFGGAGSGAASLTLSESNSSASVARLGTAPWPGTQRSRVATIVNADRSAASGHILLGIIDFDFPGDLVCVGFMDSGLMRRRKWTAR